MGLPHVPVLLSPANPLTGGLYDAASISDTLDSRHIGGMTAISPNHGPHGAWPTECPTPADTPPKGGPRPDPQEFPALIVWAADECKTVGVDSSDGEARAIHTLRLKESVEVEKHTAGLLADITPAATVNDIVAAVAHIDEALAAEGFAGVVHARRGLMAVAEAADMIIRQGTVLTTPAGHRWAFGAGYTALGDTLVGTGPVLIRRSPVTTGTAAGVETNTVLDVAERAITVGWDDPTVSVTITKGA